MKIKILTFGLTALCITCFAASIPKITQEPSYYTKGDIKVYTENYAEIYSDTLIAMFGEDYIVSDPEDIFREAEKCDCGYDQYDEQYLQWTVSYTDSSNNTKQFQFNNSRTLSYQIEQYTKNQLVDQYEKLIFDNYFSDIPIHQGGTAVYCNIASISCNADDVPKMVKKTDAYLNSLSSADKCVKLNELTVNNAFETLPLYLDIHIFVDDEALSDAQSADYISKANTEAEKVIDALTASTNGTVNAHILVNTWSAREKQRTDYYIINGKEISSCDYGDIRFYYDRYVFHAYEDIFW